MRISETERLEPESGLSLRSAPSSSIFNPMRLYVDQPEGVSLAFTVGNVKQYLYYRYFGFAWFDWFFSTGADYKNLSPKNYTRILVTNGTSTDTNEFMLQFSYSSLSEPNKIIAGEPVVIKVVENGDGTVALRCKSSERYLTWFNTDSDADIKGDGPQNDATFLFQTSTQPSPSISPPICTMWGICPTCRFSLEKGSITDISIRLVSLTWGDPGDAIPSKPSQVTEDNMINYSTTETETTLTVTYTQTKSDTTTWEHAWGFEMSVSAEVECKIPFVGGGSVTTTATASYNGKYGTENSVEESTTLQTSRKVVCPAKTTCFLKLVASKLDGFSIPFTARVEKTQDDGPPLQWDEKGTWKGVQAFNFNTVYCTTSLSTGVTNCPQFN